jgi:hypothetical protein
MDDNIVNFLKVFLVALEDEIMANRINFKN